MNKVIKGEERQPIFDPPLRRSFLTASLLGRQRRPRTHHASSSSRQSLYRCRHPPLQQPAINPPSHIPPIKGRFALIQLLWLLGREIVRSNSYDDLHVRNGCWHRHNGHYAVVQQQHHFSACKEKKRFFFIHELVD